MSWERRWRFEKLPTEIELRRHVEAVRETAGLEVACFAVRDDGDVAIQFDVPVAGAERIPAKLGVSDDAPEAILRDLDPPWPQGEDDVIPSHYTLNVDVHPQEEDDGDDEQDKRPCVSVYSNVNDNLRATPVLVALAEALAVRLGNREGHEQETAKDAVMPIPTDLSIPDALPLLYTRSFVAFPGVTFVLDIGRPSTIAAVRAAVDDRQHLVVVAQQRDVTLDAPGRDDLYDMGCVAKVLKFVRMHEDGGGTLIALGAARTRLGTLTRAGDGDLVTVACFPAAEAAPPAGDLASPVQELRADVRRLMRFIAGISQPPDLGQILDAVTDPGLYVDAVIGTTIPELQLDDCGQELLETLDTGERMRILQAIVRGRLYDWIGHLPD